MSEVEWATHCLTPVPQTCRKLVFINPTNYSFQNKVSSFITRYLLLYTVTVIGILCNAKCKNLKLQGVHKYVYLSVNVSA